MTPWIEPSEIQKRKVQRQVRGKARALAVKRDGQMVSFVRDGLILLAVSLLLLMSFLASTANAREGVDNTLAELSARLQGAVVNISTSQKVKSSPFNRRQQTPRGLPFDKFFKDYFGENGPKNQARRVSSLGSGFVIDPSGLIVTNNHVIKDADEIFINFDDGSKLEVKKVIGVDAKTDLALLKVEPEKPLKAVPFGSSAKARVGDWVMAIGNPFGLGGTVTVGIVSAKDRDINSGPYDEFIQTDAAINRGNSGGPLFNMSGEVIGVNTAIISPSGGSIGIGFSVPSDTVVNVIDQLKKYGETRRGWLGVLIQKVTPDIAEGMDVPNGEGALVSKVTKGGPAEKAGFKVGDVIVEFDGQRVKSSQKLPKIVALTDVDKTVKVQVLRNGAPKTLEVKIARLEVAEKGKVGRKPLLKSEKKQSQETYMGMTLSTLTPQLRRRYRIDRKTEGVVITKVAPNSKAHEKGLRAGFVIVDVMQTPVATPKEVIDQINAVKKSKKENAMLYIARGKGEFGFVALPSKPAG